MKIRIINPGPMGLDQRHAGKEYDAEWTVRGYILKLSTNGVPYRPTIDNQWITAGYAKIVPQDFELEEVY